MYLFKILNEFEKNNLEYALIGGFALSLHGLLRSTIDVDVVINLKEKDFIKAENVLLKIGFLPRLPVSAKEVFQFRKEYVKNKNLIAWSFYNEHNPLEILDIIIIEDLKNINIIKIQVAGHTIKVASIDDLIRLKSGTGRKQDQEDLRALKIIRDKK